MNSQIETTLYTQPAADAENGLGHPSADVIAKFFVQRMIGHFFSLPFCGIIAFLMSVVRKYSITNREEIRRQFREIAKEKGPLLICSNHLTFIDSAIIIWALAPNTWYLFNYRFFSWNLPAGDFFKKKWRYRFVAYLGKCIFIHRDGSKDHKYSILGLCKYLLNKGEVITIFPEGKRSRAGMFDIENLTSGVGRILSDLENPRVLCLYIRGHNQKEFSNYPPMGAKFNIQLKLIKPQSKFQAKARRTELLSQIGTTIKELEAKYFT